VTIYALSTRTLSGQPVSLAEYAGKVSLIVNVASACGYTPQYAHLQVLHEKLSSRGFSVLGFPSNDFGGQEPGTAEEIQEFCSTTYSVTFPLFEKVVVKDAPDQSPVYAELQRQSGKLPAWNFGKYVVGRDGRVVAYFESKVNADDPGLRGAIETALNQTA
jgi:glutathione peroxidase